MRPAPTAESLGVSPALAESMLRLLIRGSLTDAGAHSRRCRRARQRTHCDGDRRRRQDGALVQPIFWPRRAMRSASPIRPAARTAMHADTYAYIADWHDGSARPRSDRGGDAAEDRQRILQELAQRKPRGIVFDIGSLKTPLRQGIVALRAAGCRVTSVHPMFGPDTELLSGRHVIFIDLGQRGGDRRGAGAVRIHHGGAGGHDAR